MAGGEGFRVRVAMAGSGDDVLDGAGTGSEGGSERATGSKTRSMLPKYEPRE